MKLKDVLPQPPSYKIFVDLDGVLADFNKKAKEDMGIDLSSADGKATSAFFRELDRRALAGQKFFQEMDMLPDAMHLWNYLKKYNPTILSSTGRSHGAADEKRLWVRQHLGSTAAGQALFVRQAKEKSNYSGPNHILIDDRSKAIDPWIAAGGIGILHTTAASTIHRLKELGL